jgi:hypothetical protein
MRRRLLVLTFLALGAVGLAGCGNKESIRKIGELESTYLDVDSLKYQVQVSRQLNPSDAEDRSYLSGLEPGERTVRPDQVWFGVFIQVENDSDETHRSTSEFEIEDTDRRKYEPLRLSPLNVFAYRPAVLGPGDKIPLPDTPAFSGPTQGALLLFKVDRLSLDNPPLRLKITSDVVPDEVAEVDLDI